VVDVVKSLFLIEMFRSICRVEETKNGAGI
jgi:hypothetical protein